MSQTVRKFYRTKPCKLCGRPRDVVNGDWLRQQRKRARLTLADIAKRLDVSIVMIHSVEREKRNCPRYILAAYESLDSAS